jgi:hypothetical protein
MNNKILIQTEDWTVYLENLRHKSIARPCHKDMAEIYADYIRECSWVQIK